MLKEEQRKGTAMKAIINPEQPRGRAAHLKECKAEIPGYAKMSPAVQKLFQACWGIGGVKIAKQAIAMGASVNVADEDYNPALLYAFTKRAGQREVAEYLIKEGADITFRDGTTALHYAVRNNWEDIVKLLIKKGINIETKIPMSPFVNIEPKLGTALHVAASNGNVEIAEMLIAAMKVRIAEDVQDESLHANLLKFYTEAEDWQELTPLHHACQRGKIDMVKLLEAFGVEMNASTSIGYTPLHYAAIEGKEEVIEFLLTHRAKLSQETKVPPRIDVLDFAIRFNAPPKAKQVIGIQKLLAHGAVITQQHIESLKSFAVQQIKESLQFAFHMQQMLPLITQMERSEGEEGNAMPVKLGTYTISKETVSNNDVVISSLTDFFEDDYVIAVLDSLLHKEEVSNEAVTSFSNAIIALSDLKDESDETPSEETLPVSPQDSPEYAEEEVLLKTLEPAGEAIVIEHP
jgi:ankyrin repeat protein